MTAQAATPAIHLDDARKARSIALLVAGAFFMENLDGTVITTAVPDIARSFGVAPLDLNIGVSAYLLTLGVFIPISGQWRHQCAVPAGLRFSDARHPHLADRWRAVRRRPDALDAVHCL
ncbi:hypothetical protein ASR47_1007226 [Janthinobacterium psychrotolerans]|uniref:Major Facilitator Superfamily protein n=1 Tax=Janthinobacterium psychrotolerans TaxID=1747903 RepID=A0A1A7C2G5_9BURK|nr:hypothetical protein [Janthinobacterium psychrotolerans]OBV38910.1 hypothetical protein ASR47_1007226 [Janthinobacterium psychrotolerans]